MRIVALAAFTLLSIAGCEPGQDFSGTVTSVTDGDTVHVRAADNADIIVRLAEIDAPERDQPYADEATGALSNLLLRQTVTVQYGDTDRYGRTVGRIYAGDVDVSAEMVRGGLAWVYTQYVTDERLYPLENEARDARRGLWAGPDEPVPPWEWRRGARPVRVSPPGPVVAPDAPFTCGSKRYCREMASCEEAMFYRRQCGLTTIDGDNDGLPCEALCRAR